MVSQGVTAAAMSSADGPALPGAGWPGDLANPTTPVAHGLADVRRLSANAPTLERLDGRMQVCRACPRLVAWREDVALEKRASFSGERYWGRPVSGFGAGLPRVLVVGLAPAAHGANRTGRIFTGDRSGDWLYAAMHRAGLANQPTSVSAGDGLRLLHSRVISAVRCAPPANRPTPEERDTCKPWLVRELSFVARKLAVIVALGGFGWQALWPALREAGFPGIPERTPAFGHGAEVSAGASLVVLGCYHPSQQNTFTGRLTADMIDAVFTRAAVLAGVDTLGASAS